jgi:hypothetical protein
MDLNMQEMYREDARAMRDGFVVERHGLVLVGSPRGTDFTNMAIVARPVTARTVRQAVAETFVAESLAEAVLALEPRPGRVLFPCALIARQALPEALRAQARVTGRIVQFPAHDALEIERYLAAVREAGLVAEDVEIRKADLEDVFLDVMADRQKAGAAPAASSPASLEAAP